MFHSTPFVSSETEVNMNLMPTVDVLFILPLGLELTVTSLTRNAVKKKVTVTSLPLITV
jgi:hypothetical protein